MSGITHSRHLTLHTLAASKPAAAGLAKIAGR
jgi:hypothetical protein